MIKSYLSTQLRKPLFYIITGRLILLLLIASVVTQYTFNQIWDLAIISQQVKDVDKEKGEYLEGQVGTFSSAFSDISSLIKAPVALLYFDIYLYNHRQSEIIDSTERVETLMSVEIEGIYSHEIKFNELRRVATSTRGSKIPDLIVERNFTPANSIPLASTTPLKGSFYSLYIWPTRTSWLFLYLIASIPLAYAILAVINACYRFIRTGAPFTNK